MSLIEMVLLSTQYIMFLMRNSNTHSYSEPYSKINFLTVPRWYFFCGSFMFFYLVFAMPLCASVYMCLVVNCWERADLLALVCGV